MAARAGFARSARSRLTPHDLGRFPSASLFDRIGRTVCGASCLPRKELYEAWEVARRVRRIFRGGRVVDLAAGHGLLSHVMLLLDGTSPGALAVDPNRPASAAALHAALVAVWPQLAGRVVYLDADMTGIPLESTDIVVASHACGSLTDAVLRLATRARARVAVLPCCHDLKAGETGRLTGWLDGPLAIDVMRAHELHRAGYRVWTQLIPRAVTPKNRLLIGAPEATAG